MSRKGSALKMPYKALHPIECIKGGKHIPTTHEMKLDSGKRIKYNFCTKCEMIP